VGVDRVADKVRVEVVLVVDKVPAAERVEEEVKVVVAAAVVDLAEGADPTAVRVDPAVEEVKAVADSAADAAARGVLAVAVAVDSEAAGRVE
jgi:hypothetical protein